MTTQTTILDAKGPAVAPRAVPRGAAPLCCTLALLGAALAASPGCRPQEELAFCPGKVGGERADESDTRLLPYDVWLQLLIPGVTRQPLRVPEEPRECSSRPITVRWDDEAVTLADPRLKATREPRRIPEEGDMTFEAGPNGDILIWARLDYFDDGTARGPVALARWVERGVEIRGIGTLWAPHARARLRLEPFGDGEWVLVASGEVCSREEPRCRRDIYLLPLVERRFVQAPLIEGDARGPARLSAFEEREEALTGGFVRKTQIHRIIRFGGPSPVVDETISVRECDTRSDPPECVEHEGDRSQRALVWRKRAFWTDPSQWSRMGGSR